jgi:hypothetical protein
MDRRKVFGGIVIVLALIAAGLGCYLYDKQRARPALHTVAADNEVINLFFPDEQGKLETKTVEVQKHLSDKARADILLRGLKEARCIPDRLRLYDLALGEDGVLYLNVSKEFIDSESAAREIATTYAVVNSFIKSFPGVKGVQVLVEGEAVYTRNGLLYMLEPLQFNKELLEE